MAALHPVRFVMAVALTACLSACQSGPIGQAPADAPLARMIGLYRNEADALAVSQGRFGAVPSVLISSDDIKAAVRLDQPHGLSHVRTTDGREGWAATGDLTPAR